MHWLNQPVLKARAQLEKDGAFNLADMLGGGDMIE